jgi:hypothetical protein
VLKFKHSPNRIKVKKRGKESKGGEKNGGGYSK